MLARALSILLTFTICTNASACQYIVQTSLAFGAGTSDLDKAQIVKLAAWIDGATSQYPKFDYASVEAGASLRTPDEPLRGAEKRAKQRAESAARALKALFPTDIQVRTISHPYREQMAYGSSNDFAVVQLYPDQKAFPLPDCNPVPTPGFQPGR
ncbi:hypothetical protein ACCC97_11630 [Variovorax sp. Varisp85]|uniref:hypothetical protein n=1 Tax=Variovorax sp. Varisp85 TaxID=3243059 RepID=UPI0039A5E359